MLALRRSCAEAFEGRATNGGRHGAGQPLQICLLVFALVSFYFALVSFIPPLCLAHAPAFHKS